MEETLTAVEIAGKKQSAFEQIYALTLDQTVNKDPKKTVHERLEQQWQNC